MSIPQVLDWPSTKETYPFPPILSDRSERDPQDESYATSTSHTEASGGGQIQSCARSLPSVGLPHLLLCREIGIPYGDPRTGRNRGNRVYSDYFGSSYRQSSYLRLLLYSRMKLVRKVDNSFGCGQCYSVRYSPDGSVLLAGYENGQIDIMSSSSRQVNRIRGAHSDGINCFCWINSNRFLSCSDDHNLLSWDVRMPERPMQVVNVINMTPDPFHYSCYNWLKDIHFVPKSLGKPGMIYVTAFANWIYRLRLGNDDVMKPVAPVQLPVDAVRSAMLPIDGLFGENLIVSSEINHGHLESYFLPYFPASVELPDYVRPNENCCKSVSVDPGSRHGSYRGLKPDPGGGGLLAKKTMYCKLRGVYSAVTYYRLESKEKDATIPSKMIRTLFMRDKCSEEILQEPAFAPNGCFVANPQDRRVDILTNGRSAVPFRHFGNRPEQFHVATTLRMASCSDILCCDISPRDSVTVASGCTMGHVHLAQPVL